MPAIFRTRAACVCALVVACLFALTASAQNERRFTFEVGGGFTPPVGQLSDRLNSGWNMGAGAGLNFGSVFSLGAKYMYNGFGVNSAVLTQAGVPGGDAHVWSITAEPKLQLGRGRQFSPYIAGGVGYYRRTVNFTQPALANVTFFDPFFGFFPGVVGTNQVLAMVTRSGVGGSLGAGLSFALGHSGTQFFTEARYHYADTGNIPTRMVPVTFGLRF